MSHTHKKSYDNCARYNSVHIGHGQASNILKPQEERNKRQKKEPLDKNGNRKRETKILSVLLPSITTYTRAV